MSIRLQSIVNKTLRQFGLQIKKSEKDIFNLDLYNEIYPKESRESKRFYNVGAGSFSHPYWTNVDYLSDWYKSNKKLIIKGIHHDLFSLTPFPIDDDTAEIVYSSHAIEHIKDEHAQFFFNEAFRFLKIDGLLRITCPDIDLHYAAMNRNDFDFYYWKNWYRREKDYKRIVLNMPLDKASIEQLFVQRFATAFSTLHADGAEERINDDELRRVFSELKYEDALDFCCNKCPIEIQQKYPGNHTNWWNRSKTIRMLEIAGFKDIYVSGYGQSQSPVLRNTTLFDSTHPKISLYIETRK